jgi:hypothetical protein
MLFGQSGPGRNRFEFRCGNADCELQNWITYSDSDSYLAISCPLCGQRMQEVK